MELAKQDFNNSLMAISGNLAMLQRKLDTDAQTLKMGRASAFSKCVIKMMTAA
jgi:hypothetical protein